MSIDVGNNQLWAILGNTEANCEMENPTSSEVKKLEVGDHPETTVKDLRGGFLSEDQSEGDQSDVADVSTDRNKKELTLENVHEEVLDNSIDHPGTTQVVDNLQNIRNDKAEPHKEYPQQQSSNAHQIPVEHVKQQPGASEQTDDKSVHEEKSTAEQENIKSQANEEKSVSDTVQTEVEGNSSQQVLVQPKEGTHEETDGSIHTNKIEQQNEELVLISHDPPVSSANPDSEQGAFVVQQIDPVDNSEAIQESSSGLAAKHDQPDEGLDQETVDTTIADLHKETVNQELHLDTSVQSNGLSTSGEPGETGAPAYEGPDQEEVFLAAKSGQPIVEEAHPTSQENFQQESHTTLQKASEEQEKEAVQSHASEKKEEVVYSAETRNIDADLESITNMIESLAIVGASQNIPQTNETSITQNPEPPASDSQKNCSSAAEEQPGASHPEPYRLTKDSHSSETEIEEAKTVAAAATADHDLRSSNEAEREVGNENRPFQLPVSSPASSSRPEPTPPGEMLHHIKHVQFKDKDVGIVTQNENGPCPLVAIINVLLLRWQITLSPSTEIVSAAKLMEYIGDTMLESVPKNLSGEVRLNYEQNMHDAMAVLPKLQTGLDVNVKFTGVKDFEYTPECIIFDLLRIPLFHGWLVDPQAQEVAKAVGQAGYNQLVEKVISQKCSTNEDAVTEALIIENFLERTASQLTYHGLTELNAAMSDGEIGVLFRNNHFSTIYKHQKELLQLVTDQGFLGESSVVWETLSSIDGDGQFVDSHFRTVPPRPETSGTSSSPNTSGHLTAEQQIDHDFLVALSLQEEQQPAAIQEDMECEPVVLSDAEKTTQEKADEELARQLQREEERQAAEAAREPPADAPQQQTQEAQGARSPTQQPKKKDNCNIL